MRASAKINLHLEVFHKRPDGFHDLSSLFQAVDLYDDIYVRSLKEQETIEIFGDFDCPPENTTIWKAVSLFRKASGIRQGISICVEKRIPAGAGLGGGSSDAASVLRALNEANGRCLAPEVLSSLAASVGSDVPFFLSGGSALASGRGERLAETPSRTDFSVVVVFPGFPVSTAWAYSKLDEHSAHADPAHALEPSELTRIYSQPP
ncbi:MAG: 4-(cytidine 5'-diphospho)-2-C-methyl-D-erythritol kinase, partial [Rectinemataceae bacterium]|nr:4-(cytidine 5'-diphospho)-2-C-methyl-D-erythritol kinase [Rectinemataceae bacterium]